MEETTASVVQQAPTITDYDDSLGTTIHFSALLPEKSITVDHVRRVMGMRKYTADEYEKMKENWQELKKGCRYWASQAIKREMISATNAVHDIPSEQGKALYGHLARQPGWKTRMKKEYMALNKLSYSQESVDDAQKKCLRKGYKVAGCIVQNMSEVKGELVKNMRKCTKSFNHRYVVSENRKHEDAFDKQGLYTRRNTHDYVATYFGGNGSGNESLPSVSAGFLFFAHFYLEIVAANLMHC
jgi:hypothetical protein